MKNKDIGMLGEEIGCRYLIAQGQSVIARNVRVGDAEIDIVTRENNLFRFIEVKTVARERIASSFRTAGEDQNPLQRVTREKISVLASAIELYVARHGITDWIFCLLGVTLSPDEGSAYCELFVEHSI
jgi:putative endonuclease